MVDGGDGERSLSLRSSAFNITIVANLFLGQGSGLIRVLVGCAIPLDGFFDRLMEVPARSPTEHVVRFIGGEIEEGSLVRGMRVGFVFPGARPVFQHLFDEAADRSVGGQVRAKIEGCAKLGVGEPSLQRGLALEPAQS